MKKLNTIIISLIGMTNILFGAPGDISGLNVRTGVGVKRPITIYTPSNGATMFFTGDPNDPLQIRPIDGSDITESSIDVTKVIPSSFLLYNERDYKLRDFFQVKSVAELDPVDDFVGDGISGTTYSSASGTLFHIRNVAAAAGNVYEMTEEGNTIRIISNVNFEDTESIEWIGRDDTTGYDIFLVAEEDHTTAANESRLSLCRISQGDTTLDRTELGNVSATTAYSGGTIGNLGIEAVAYDTRRSTIYYTAEKRTSNTFNIAGSTQARIFARTITTSGTLSFGSEYELCTINALYTGAILTDISGMAYDALTDTILLLSDESKKVVRISLQGTYIEELELFGTQPEGLALQPDGKKLFITGEPREYFRFERGNTYQKSNIDLSSISEISGQGFLTKFDNGVYNLRSLVAASDNITITDGDGSAGNPTIDVDEGSLELGNMGGELPFHKIDYTQAIIPSTTIDWFNGAVHTKTLSANTTFSFANPSNGDRITVAITNTVANYTVTWPGGVLWPGGAAPTQTIGVKTDIYSFIQIAGVIYGSVVQNY